MTTKIAAKGVSRISAFYGGTFLTLQCSIAQPSLPALLPPPPPAKSVPAVQGSPGAPAGLTVSAAAPAPKSYSLRGVVQQVAADRSVAVIHHQDVPGFMPEMTMEFKVRDTNELTGLVPGAEITFRLQVLPRDAWIDQVHGTGKVPAPPAAPLNPPDEATPELKAGDFWPDAELLAEDGRRLHFSDFRGRTLAVTFFFTRCPLPDFCPRMNRDFAEARALLQSTPGTPTNCAFLSVSFDPDFDTPHQLAAYAQTVRGDGVADQWLFAAAPPATLAHLPRRLGLRVNRRDTAINHNLRTVVLDAQGRVYRQFDGNNWSPQELVNAMKEASQETNLTSVP